MDSARPFVALVDDEESVRRALSRLLLASGFDVVAFSSGQEFLDALEARRPDCVLLDLKMSGLSGRDVQQRLAAAHCNVPVIIITAVEDAVLREQCLADGAVGYLNKPINGVKLIATIRVALIR